MISSTSLNGPECEPHRESRRDEGFEDGGSQPPVEEPGTPNPRTPKPGPPRTSRMGRYKRRCRRRLLDLGRCLYRWVNGTLYQGNPPSKQNKKSIKQRFLKLLPCCRTGSAPSPNQNSEADDGELSTVCYRPEGLDQLVQQTNFNRRELQILYRSFKNECPSGVVNEETFKTIYSQFFPQGDSSMYAHFLFDAFDTHNNGTVSFEDFVMGLSIILRGSITDKLNWAFNLYDINKDGCITKEEMTDIMHSIYDMMGKCTYPCMRESAPMEQVEHFFQKMDKNNDGVVTIEEFLDSCQKDENIMQSMHMFDSVI